MPKQRTYWISVPHRFFYYNFCVWIKLKILLPKLISHYIKREFHFWDTISISERVKKPKSCLQSVISVIRDEFREQPLNTNRVVGDDVILQCRPPRGDPEPRVQWKKNGTFVSTGNRFHIQEDGSLLIRNSEKADAGLYSCIAQNIGGQRESKAARLSILGTSVVAALRYFVI